MKRTGLNRRRCSTKLLSGPQFAKNCSKLWINSERYRGRPLEFFSMRVSSAGRLLLVGAITAASLACDVQRKPNAPCPVLSPGKPDPIPAKTWNGLSQSTQTHLRTIPPDDFKLLDDAFGKGSPKALKAWEEILTASKFKWLKDRLIKGDVCGFNIYPALKEQVAQAKNGEKGLMTSIMIQFNSETEVESAIKAEADNWLKYIRCMESKKPEQREAIVEYSLAVIREKLKNAENK